MNITLGVTILRWRIGTVSIRVDVDEIASAAGLPALMPAAPRIMDAVSDYFANRWASRHMGP